MQTLIQGNPDCGDLMIDLGPGEKVIAESGAMSRMSDGLEMKSRLMGGFFRALIRKLFGGQSFFVTHYTAPNGGHVAFSPNQPGTILQRDLLETSLFLTAGSFLACGPDVEVRPRWGGFKALFSGEGAFFLECSGRGPLFFSSYGAVIEKEIEGTFTVDTGHVVGWEPTLDYSIGGMGGIKSTLFSGEGLVLKFKGTGKIYLQTRYLSGLAGWLSPFCR
mgnify:CR=1 FL=1